MPSLQPKPPKPPALRAASGRCMICCSEHQNALQDRDLLTYAAALDLDLERFAAELEAGVHTPRVREDFLSGVRSGVNGTPAFFINGARYDGSVDFASLSAAINAAASSLLEIPSAFPRRSSQLP